MLSHVVGPGWYPEPWALCPRCLMDKLSLTVSDLVAGNDVYPEENSEWGKEVRGWQPSPSD